MNSYDWALLHYVVRCGQCADLLPVKVWSFSCFICHTASENKELNDGPVSLNLWRGFYCLLIFHDAKWSSFASKTCRDFLFRNLKACVEYRTTADQFDVWDFVWFTRRRPGGGGTRSDYGVHGGSAVCIFALTMWATQIRDYRWSTYCTCCPQMAIKRINQVNG